MPVNTIVEKHSDITTVFPPPGALAPGEVALNIADAKIFLEKEDGNLAHFNEWEPFLHEVADEAGRDALVTSGVVRNGQYCFYDTRSTDGNGFVSIREYLWMWSNNKWWLIDIYEPQPLIYRWDRLQDMHSDGAGASYVIAGGQAKISYNGGGSWSNLTEDGASHGLPGSAAGPCIIKELIPHTVYKLSLDADLSSVNFHGACVASGGALTSLSGLFHDLTGLTSADISNLNTEKVTNMSNVFKACSNLNFINVSGLNTDRVTTMTNMFNDCPKIKNLDLTSWNFDKVTNMNSMIRSCGQLKCITNLNTTNASAANLFDGCGALLQPNAAARTDLRDANGADWVNAEFCV